MFGEAEQRKTFCHSSTVAELKINLNIHGVGPVEPLNRTKEQRSKMKIKRLNVDWDKQFPMRAAVQLVRVTRRFRSRIQLRIGAEVADARNVLSILILVSSLTTYLDVEASGDDEQEAVQAVVDHLNHNSDHNA